MSRILLHICCAPCAVYPLRQLGSEGNEVVCFFYNPNIHPYREYAQRLESVHRLEAVTCAPVLYRDEYGLEVFLRHVVFLEQDRCATCYKLRLEEAARTAAENGFDAFTTTLLYSKFQKHELIRETGEVAGKACNVPFLYRDFRVGWREGVESSKAMNLYRQPYCGCVYSEWERYRPRSTPSRRRP